MTPIKKGNVMQVTMGLYGGFIYKSPSKQRKDRLRKYRFLAQFGEDYVLMLIPVSGPGTFLAL